MRVIHELSSVKEDCAFTLGMFDGVHRGHQYLLKKLCSSGLPSVVLTFPEHPLKALGRPAPWLITTINEKLALLEKFGVDVVVVVEFTPTFALTPFDQLLSALPVKQLVFGKGAVFGKDRQGDETAVRAWAKKHHVGVEYIEKTIPVSSSRIREAIAAGDMALAEQLLGYRKSI